MLRWYALIGILLFGYSRASAGAEIYQLSFGVVPQQSATTLARTWTPVLTYLGRTTGYRLHFKTAKDIPTFEQRLSRGDYDIAYMNPYHYTVFSREPGYRVFAKEKSVKLQGIVVVRKDSKLRTIAELSGEPLAFPAPLAFAATLLPQAQLRQLNIRFSASYLSSHDSVYRAVAKGLFPAGGGIMRTFSNIHPDIRDKLRILWRSKEFAPHAITAHPRVPNHVLTVVREAMLTMSHDRAGMSLLNNIGFSGIVAAQDAEYDDIRELALKLLDDTTK